MNAKELIEAAKSVVEHKNHTGIKDYAFIFAEHTLATVREDDDEPVTPEQESELPSGLSLCFTRGIPCCFLESSTHRICEVKTRGQLRKLLEALVVK